MITITTSEIPAFPKGTTFASHEDASNALTALAKIMPETWDAFKFSVGLKGISTPDFELRRGEDVDTSLVITSWIEFADRHGKPMDYQRAFEKGSTKC